MNAPLSTQQMARTNQPPAVVAGWLYVPYWAMDAGLGMEREKKALTFRPKHAPKSEPPILAFKEMPGKPYLAIPRAYGRERFPWLACANRMTLGEAFLQPVPRRPDPNHPSVREPERQRQFMLDLRAAAREHGSFVAKAATGSGKTVCALDTAAEMGRKTIINVHLERLRDQWLDEIKDKLGVPEERIGVVQGPDCEFEGKDFVVAMMPSLAMRKDYPPEFYASFGTVIYDEVHRVGSPLLSACAPLFPGTYRWGISATPNRKDGLDPLIFYHIGPIRVESNARALECTVYVKRYRSTRRFHTSNQMSQLKELSKDPARNAMLADLIRRNFATGRNILVIGKFVEHLQDIMDLCAQKGIPREKMGQYTGEALDRRLVRKKGRLVRETVGRRKVKKETYEAIKAQSQIIFATYGMFKEGIDVPRLDCGIDVLPQGEATQVIGRIRRPKEGKPLPYWITIYDTHWPAATPIFQRRVADYRKTGCRIVDNGKL